MVTSVGSLFLQVALAHQASSFLGWLVQLVINTDTDKEGIRDMEDAEELEPDFPVRTIVAIDYTV